MKSLNQKELKKFVLELYAKYVGGDKINDTAKKIFLDYSGAEQFIENKLYEAILYLETIGWELNPSMKEAKEILPNLIQQSIDLIEIQEVDPHKIIEAKLLEAYKINKRAIILNLR